MVSFGRWWVGCAALFMLLTTVWMVGAQSALEPDSVQIEFADSAAPLSKGQTFIVNVVSRMETPVYGFGFQIQFDPKQLKLFPRPGRDGTESPLVVGELFGHDPQRVKNAVEAAPDAALSQVDVVYTLLPPETAMQGSGVIGSIAFTIIGDGKSEIRLVNPRLIQVSDGQAQDIAIKIGTSTLTLDTTSGTAGVAQPQTVTASTTTTTSTSESRLPVLVVLVIALVVALIVTLIFARKLIRSR
jgi:hypothetical protein